MSGIASHATVDSSQLTFKFRGGSQLNFNIHLQTASESTSLKKRWGHAAADKSARWRDGAKRLGSGEVGGFRMSPKWMEGKKNRRKKRAVQIMSDNLTSMTNL